MGKIPKNIIGNDIVTTTPENDKSIGVKYPELLKEWNYEKNIMLNIANPEKLTIRNKTLIFWKCQNGHEWQASIHNRISKGLSCPLCLGTAISKEVNAMLSCTDNANGNEVENNIAVKYPELLKEWDYEKNTPLGLTPKMITDKCRKNIHWKCENGHEWIAKINYRLSRKSCPYCEPIDIENFLPVANNKKTTDSQTPYDKIKKRKVVTEGVNDLATTNPELLKEWDYDRNTPLGLYPTKLSARMNRKVWWKCQNGHSWSAVIYSRTRGSGCPFCANKIKSQKKNKEI